MQVNSTSSATSSQGISASGGQLGKDEFLKLLMAQLKNQDPMKPMDDSQFIAQLAQFSSLESMQALDDRMASLLRVQMMGQAYGLIGKEIEAPSGTQGETIKGVADSAKMVDGDAVLTVGGKSVKLAEVTSVAEGEGAQLAQASSLLKTEVEAVIAGTDERVTGVVDAVKVENGTVVLRIGSRTVELRDVVSVEQGDREM